MGNVLRNLTRLWQSRWRWRCRLPRSTARRSRPAPRSRPPPKRNNGWRKRRPEGAGDEKSKTAALVQQAFDAGIKAYGVGKNEEALRAFEAAIRGGLPSAQMPRMLYYRGLTFRKLGKPGFAVSDLTSALWLKSGLSEAERADAIKVRALAYNEAGVSDVPPVPQSSYAEAPAMPGQSNTGARTANGNGRRRSCSGRQLQRTRRADTVRRARAASCGFFSSLFGGGSSSEEKPAEAARRAPHRWRRNAPPPAIAPAGQTRLWELAHRGAPEIVAPHVAPRRQRAPRDRRPVRRPDRFRRRAPRRSAPDAAPVARSAPSGKFRLQVAAVRSRSEAEALAGLVVGRPCRATRRPPAGGRRNGYRQHGHLLPGTPRALRQRQGARATVRCAALGRLRLPGRGAIASHLTLCRSLARCGLSCALTPARNPWESPATSTGGAIRSVRGEHSWPGSPDFR